MMIGEAHSHHNHLPPWSESLNQTVQITSSSPSPFPPQSNGAPHSPTYYDAVLTSLRRYLLTGSSADQESPPSPMAVGEYSGDVDFSITGEYDDDFFMYEFKVRMCTRVRAHDWTECLFAHPGEKARRRDPRKYSYSGTSCSEFRKGNCRKGDGCEFAHGVYECWLHPSRFRTQACKDGPGCKRRVCFFAHSADQLRASGSGLTTPRTPYSLGEDGFRSGAVAELTASLRSLQLNKVKSMPSSWVCGSPVFGSPRGVGVGSPVNRAGFFSLPTTPTRLDCGVWGSSKEIEDEEPMMERVESGRELRAKMFEKLSKENPLNGSGLLGLGLGSGSGTAPDFGWVSDLIE